MNKMDSTEVLNEYIEDLIDFLKHKITMIGMDHGLSDSQISDMERDFIARLAFAAIIGDDEKEPEKKPEKSDKLPDGVINVLSFVKDYCLEHDCDNCIFHGLEACKLKYTPNEWRI